MKWLPLALLLACSSARPITLPSGRPGFYVKCRGDEARCFSRASLVCPRGYRVVHARSDETIVMTGGDGYAVGASHFGRGGMMIECGGRVDEDE